MPCIKINETLSIGDKEYPVYDCVTPYQWTHDCIGQETYEWHSEYWCKKCHAQFDPRYHLDDDDLYEFFDKHKACFPPEMTTGPGKDMPAEGPSIAVNALLNSAGEE